MQRIQRFYQTGELNVGTDCDLDARNHHYLAHVLRAQVPTSLVLFNGDGFDYSATLTHCDKRRATVHLETQLPAAAESPLQIHLLQGISRSDRMDLSLQKAVELGVQHITPMHCERTNMKWDATRLAKKMRHWQSVIISACEQSGRAVLPDLMPPVTLPNIHQAPALSLLLDPQAKQSFTSFHDNTSSPKHVRLAIGPEGGFSDAERAHLHAQQFVSLRLGPRILRTETAGLASITLAQSLWGDLG